MKRYLLYFILSFIACNSKPDPTYNPFDNVFDVNLDKIKSEKWDTISAGCGYYNLTKKLDDHFMYYQFYELNDTVVAKGLEIHIDTIFFEYGTGQEKYDTISEIISTYPVDTVRVDQILMNYNLQRKNVLKNNDYNYWIYTGIEGDTHKLTQNHYFDGKREFIRILTYFHSE